MLIERDEPLGVQVTEAIQGGDLDELRRLLAAHPGLAQARLVERRAEDGSEAQRTLLHVATDYPGHCPENPATVVLLIEAGADVNAPFVGFHRETP
ncbi:MAG TPA: ankyrin repeat domain-containing protein, partial [Limnochordia bacterium]|nr:ankyrin repeat domain-containing protein [Limnochordia bacterium]